MTTHVDESSNGPLPVHYTLGVRELFLVAWRRKYLALVCILLSLGFGALYFVRTPHTYEVKARLLVERQDMPLATGQPEKPAKDLDFLATQAEILKSPAVVSRAAEQIEWLSKSPHLSPTQSMIGDLAVRPVMGTSVLSIGFQASDSERAVQAVTAIVDSYRHYLNETERGAHLETLGLLTRNEKELRSDLQELEEQYVTLRKNSPLAGKGKGGVDVHMALVEELGRQLAQARNSRIQLENQLQIVEHGRKQPGDFAEVSTTNTGGYVGYVKSTSTAGGNSQQTELAEATGASQLAAAKAANTAELENLQKQLTEAQMREKELAERYGHKHPDLRAVREQIIELTAQYQQAINDAPEVLRNQLEAANANEQRLTEVYQVELETAKSIDQFILEEHQLVGQIDRVRASHDSLLDQLRHWKLTDEAVADGRSRVRVTLLEQPTIPLKPVWPDPGLLFGVCGLIGLVASAGVITFLEVRSPSVREKLAASPVAVNPLVPAIGGA